MIPLGFPGIWTKWLRLGGIQRDADHKWKNSRDLAGSTGIRPGSVHGNSFCKSRPGPLRFRGSRPESPGSQSLMFTYIFWMSHDDRPQFDKMLNIKHIVLYYMLYTLIVFSILIYTRYLFKSSSTNNSLYTLIYSYIFLALRQISIIIVINILCMDWNFKY